jgi:Arylsulfotransferase (ASST)
LHVIPFPGTLDASPLSDIIFSALRRSDLRTVKVTGSGSGPHTGRLTELPDGAGTAFIPRHPFKPGERVTVVAGLRSAAGGTASGDPGSAVLRFSFTVGISVPWNGARGDRPRPAARRASAGPTQSFRSRTDLHPPIISASSDHDRSSGDILLTPVATQVGSMQAGPMILDPRGRLVWFRPVHGYATNLEVQRYHGDPALTWWQRGESVQGEDVIFGRSYRRIAVVRAGYGYVADIHEFQLTPRGTALIDAYDPVRADLSSINGPSQGPLMDCVIQEVDVKTGRVLWEWHALGHVPLRDAYMGTPRPGVTYDFFHLNSVQGLPNGNLLVSARDTWGVYEIDKQTGKVIWTLGGRHSDFKMGTGTNFEWQHDARLHPGGIMSVFDDASNTNAQEESQSSAKTIKLDMARMTATLVRQYTHTPPVTSGAEGSAQLLPNRNVFVGWGQQPEFSEYTAAGRQIFTASLPLGIRSYRAFRSPWSGQPANPPAMALSRQNNGSTKVYASWNGATRVAAWRLLAGTRRGALHAVTQTPRNGFETVLTLHTRARYAAVAALNAGGKVLGTSKVHATGR